MSAFNFFSKFPLVNGASNGNRTGTTSSIRQRSNVSDQSQQQHMHQQSQQPQQQQQQQQQQQHQQSQQQQQQQTSQQLGFNPNYPTPLGGMLQSLGGRSSAYVHSHQLQQHSHQQSIVSMSTRGCSTHHQHRMITKNSNHYYPNPYGSNQNNNEFDESSAQYNRPGPSQYAAGHTYESYPRDPNRMSYLYTMNNPSRSSCHYGGLSTYQANLNDLQNAMFNSCFNEKYFNTSATDNTIASMSNTTLNPQANDFIPTPNFNLSNSSEFVRFELERHRFNERFNPQHRNNSLANNQSSEGNNNNNNSNINDSNGNLMAEKEQPRREVNTKQFYDSDFEEDFVNSNLEGIWNHSPVKNDRSTEQLFDRSFNSSMRQLWTTQAPTLSSKQQAKDNKTNEYLKMTTEAADDFDINTFNKEVYNTTFEEKSIFENSLDEIVVGNPLNRLNGSLGEQSLIATFNTESEPELDESEEEVTIEEAVPEERSPIVMLPLTPLSNRNVSSPQHLLPAAHQPLNEIEPRPRSDSVTSIKSNLSTRFKEQLYKTEMCRYMVETNNCKYGEACRFAHNENELRKVERSQRENYRTETCHEYSHGICYFGWRCWFRHEKQPFDNDAFQATLIDLYFNPFLGDYLEKVILPFLGTRRFVPLQ